MIEEIIKQEYQVIVAGLALIVSVVSLWRDKRTRQLNLLDDVYRRLSEISDNLNDILDMEDKEDQAKAADISVEEKLNEYEYLAFLINNKQASEKYAYELGYEDIISLEKKFPDDLNKDDYPQYFRLVKRWRKYPPTNPYNRIVSWFLRTFKNTDIYG